MNCPGRPVVDPLDNIHVIWDGTGDTVFYGFSSDTLNTFTVEQSIIPAGEFAFFVSSPDHQYTAALFYNYQEGEIYKYMAETGEALDLLGDPEVVPCTTNISNAFDIALDYEGNIHFVKWISRWWNWGDHYYWSETHGYRYLRIAGDDVQDGINYQIAFGEDQSEILVINNDFYNETRFYCSLDGGNVWGISDYQRDEGFCTSTTRIFTDTIHMVYHDWHSTFYFPVRKSVIFDELTGVSDSNIKIPQSFSLSNYPNPLNAATTISFNLPEAGEVRLAVYDISGRLVTMLLDQTVESGAHSILWDATDRNGGDVASGIYLYSLVSNSGTVSNRMLLLK